MPPVWYGKIVDRLTFWDNLAAGKMADTIVAYTRDFAEHSPFLSRFLGETDAGTGRRGDGETGRRGDTDTPTYSHTPTHSNTASHSKVRVILPPVVIPDPTPEGVAALRERIGWHEGQKVIGFAARFAYEKGADYLINAIPHILDAFPDIRILFAGPYGNDVIGETIWDSLQPLIKKYERYLTFLGTLNPAQMADFYADVRCGHGRLDQQHRVVRAGAGGGVHVRYAGGRHQPARRPPAGDDDRHGRDRADRRCRGAGPGCDQGAARASEIHQAARRDHADL